jgi:hypothetical protein
MPLREKNKTTTTSQESNPRPRHTRVRDVQLVRVARYGEAAHHLDRRGRVGPARGNGLDQHPIFGEKVHFSRR